MIFVLDTGNTNTVLGVFKEGELIHEWRIKTDRYKTEDEFGMLIQALFDHKGIRFSDFSGVIMSSVVPPMMDALEKMCAIYFELTPFVVGRSDVNIPLRMAYPHPEEIGADRLVNAVGAIEEYGAPVIIIDFGTATTYCYVDQEGAYYGGLISPGVKISMDALYQKASKLPKIEIQAPEQVIGTSTVKAMQSGVFYGYVSQVDGTINRMKKEIGIDPTVIATGGLAPLIADASETIEFVDVHLTLKGLYIIYNDNR